MILHKLDLTPSSINTPTEDIRKIDNEINKATNMASLISTLKKKFQIDIGQSEGEEPKMCFKLNKDNEDCEGYTEGEKIAAITPNAQEIYTAITEAGNLYIWGQDTTANLVDSSTPVKMDTGGPVKLAAATDDSICVVMADNKFKIQ